jgi:hypothetical protein
MKGYINLPEEFRKRLSGKSVEFNPSDIWLTLHRPEKKTENYSFELRILPSSSPLSVLSCRLWRSKSSIKDSSVVWSIIDWLLRWSSLLRISASYIRINIYSNKQN